MKFNCSGVPEDFSTLTSNSLFRTTFKQSDIPSLRKVVEREPSPTPSIISEKCKSMVLEYTNKLYKDQAGYDDVEAFTKMVVRLMPRPYIEFSADLFSKVINLFYFCKYEQKFSCSSRKSSKSSPELARI